MLTAGAATPLAEIERALAECGQMLAFEPPDWRGSARAGRRTDCQPTLGGALACNLSGPRRIKAGAARDHFLGFRGVSGRGEIFKAGGKVVKNVTGYDLCKLMAGSYGTLAALEEVTVKVLPRPETVATVLFSGVAPGAAVRLMAAALGSPHEVSGAAYLPAGTAGLARGPRRAARRGAGALGRGAPRQPARASIAAPARPSCSATPNRRRCGARSARSRRWREAGERAVWRISVAPARGAELAEALARALDATMAARLGRRAGLGWRCRRPGATPAPRRSARAIRGNDGRGTGHATLVKASAALRRAVAGVRAAARRRSPRCRAASRRRSTRRISSIPAAWSRTKPGEADNVADRILAGPARRPRYRGVGKDPADLRALRVLHRDLPDLCAARRRTRQPARPHLPDQEHARRGREGRRRKPSSISTAACPAWHA